MKVRYVALVPVVFEEDVIGDEKFITHWGREYLQVNYAPVESLHPRRGFPYDPQLIEAVRINEPVEIDLGDLIAPGLITT